jgi:hypothetical protein
MEAMRLLEPSDMSCVVVVPAHLLCTSTSLASLSKGRQCIGRVKSSQGAGTLHKSGQFAKGIGSCRLLGHVGYQCVWKPNPPRMEGGLGNTPANQL